jgi:lipopolysaccharide transport system permease protein
MAIGFFWAVARPLAMVAIFTFVKIQSGANMHVEIAYPLYLYSGLIMWFNFREATMATSKSVMKEAGLMKRIYYPRMVAPIVPVVAQMYSLFIGMIPLAVMMVFYQSYPSWRIVLLPLVLLQYLLFILSVGMIFSCLILFKADFEKFLTLCLYLGLFISPVIFAPEMIPESVRFLYFANPTAGTLLAFRACLFADFPFPVWEFVFACVLSIILTYTAIKLYGRTESYFADKL